MRARHVLVAAVVVGLLLPLAGALANSKEDQPVELTASGATSEDQDRGRAAVKPAKQEPTVVTRHDLMARIDTGVGKAGSLLAQAEGLLVQGDTVEAISLLNRITSMVEGRPDWCLSRQRAWGVEIPALYRRACDEPLLDPAFIRGG